MTIDEVIAVLERADSALKVAERSEVMRIMSYPTRGRLAKAQNELAAVLASLRRSNRDWTRLMREAKSNTTP